MYRKSMTFYNDKERHFLNEIPKSFLGQEEIIMTFNFSDAFGGSIKMIEMCNKLTGLIVSNDRTNRMIKVIE